MTALDPGPFRLVVFDWDGTLMDSVGSIVACTQAVLREMKMDEVPEPTIRGTIGLGMRETIEVLVPGCSDELYERIIDTYRNQWWSTFRDRPVLFPGVDAMLRSLSAEGYLLAVATGKSRRGLDHSLEQTGLRELFHSTRTADEAFSKPHPRMLFDILDDLGVKPSEAVMVGDTTFDLEMARNAGTAGVGVCTGSHCREELQELAPLVCLERVADLPDWLAKRSS